MRAGDVDKLHVERSCACHADKYTVSQHSARTLRESGSNDIAYGTIRQIGGECAVVFRLLLSGTPGKSGISATSGIAGKSQPSMRNGNSTMTGGPRDLLTNVRRIARSASAEALCAAHAVARQARQARDLGEAGRELGIAGW